ncbi:uncharacterized protein LOC131928744 isoform X2 [Physella acuta]|uniref:uncharacterized protein LOC131928744 isoform X2 n=1 Tax=Physella acuta TaxID=109671 RepID=UPI0027DACB07|nr:uncharacterized protein LOC131928744 isoform X2 [Physella acuta]
MATLYGFKFNDGDAFNSHLTDDDINKLQRKNAHIWISRIVNRLIEKHKLSEKEGVPVVEIKEGGFSECTEIGKIAATTTTVEEEPAAVPDSPEPQEELPTEDEEWSDKMIKLLIHTRRDLAVKFCGSGIKKKDAWECVAKVLRKEGQKITGNECDKKYRDLKRTYLMNFQKMRKHGPMAVKWPYYEVMREALQVDPTMEPRALKAPWALAFSDATDDELEPGTSKKRKLIESLEEEEKHFKTAIDQLLAISRTTTKLIQEHVRASRTAEAVRLSIEKQKLELMKALLPKVQETVQGKNSKATTKAYTVSLVPQTSKEQTATPAKPST